MKRFFLVLALLMLASTAAINAWHVIGGAMGEQLMDHCPVGQNTTSCVMTVSEHVGGWLSLFTATLSIATAFGALALAFVHLRERARSADAAYSPPAAPAFFRFARMVPAPSDISRGLISGIVHPKLFAFAVR